MSWSPFSRRAGAVPTRGENRARPPALLRKPTTNVRLSPSSYNVGRTRPLIVRCRGSSPAPRPSPGDLVLLADPGLVLEPDLYRLARRVALGDLVEALGEVFLNAAMASASWA